MYNEVFTMHATLMIFLFVIPILAGFGNYVMPLQIGAPDMAFPRINALSFWMLPLGGFLILLGFVTGGTAAAGWTSYSPLAQDRPLGSTGSGQDLWIVGLTLVGTSSILGAVNFLATIFKMRAPGMTLFRMPLLTWTVLVTAVLVLLATPVFTSAVIMLFIDRNLGGSFFDPANGGDAILYQNVFWFYSHPAVYVMILIAMGTVSEILPVFSRKPLFGYKAFVFATVAIGALGFSVWAHHMFTTGAVYLPFFSLMTFLIAVPTGVKFFNWIFTMWRGQMGRHTPVVRDRLPDHVPDRGHQRRVQRLGPGRLRPPRHLLRGGPPSLRPVRRVRLRDHGGLYYWFPKMTGRMLNETLGKIQFVLMFVGFNMTFFPMHELGLSGMPRRIADYSSTAGWNDLNLVATIGGFTIAASMVPLLWNVFLSLRSGQIAGDDPWEGNTLEWATTSPPPPYNFDRLPEIRSERPVFDVRHGRRRPGPRREH